MSVVWNFSWLAEVLAFLLKNKLIDGNNMTVTGLTLGENLERWTHKFGELDHTQDVIRPLDNPIKPTGHIRWVALSPGVSYRTELQLEFSRATLHLGAR